MIRASSKLRNGFSCPASRAASCLFSHHVHKFPTSPILKSRPNRVTFVSQLCCRHYSRTSSSRRSPGKIFLLGRSLYTEYWLPVRFTFSYYRRRYLFLIGSFPLAAVFLYTVVFHFTTATYWSNTEEHLIGEWVKNYLIENHAVIEEALKKRLTPPQADDNSTTIRHYNHEAPIEDLPSQHSFSINWNYNQKDFQKQSLANYVILSQIPIPIVEFMAQYSNYFKDYAMKKFSLWEFSHPSVLRIRDDVTGKTFNADLLVHAERFKGRTTVREMVLMPQKRSDFSKVIFFTHRNLRDPHTRRYTIEYHMDRKHPTQYIPPESPLMEESYNLHGKKLEKRKEFDRQGKLQEDSLLREAYTNSDLQMKSPS